MDVKSLIPWGRTSRAPALRSEDADPFLTLHRQMNRLFDDVFRDFNLPLSRNAGSFGWPSVEISEDDKQIKVVAELPGLEEKDVDLSFRDGILTLSGERKSETNHASYSERWHGQFSRSIDVGADIDPDKVEARFNKGMLTVTLPRRPEAQAQRRRIAITHES
ncbi:MAG TPA: Hsp20/alpha crystallin family protein [Rhizomicrobium sp.]|nr:Hsp20/alpha crystallin family protein [Rhizomicrobium sp.]